MRRLLALLAAIAMAAVVCAPAQAQSRRMRTRVVSAPPGTQVIRTSGDGVSGAPVTVSNPAGTVSGNSVDRLLNGSYPAPGLGFDYTHLAAVNRNLGVRALVDPITQHRLAQERNLRRSAPIAAAPAFPVVVNSIVVNVLPQPPVVIIQEPEPEPESIGRVQFVERAAPVGAAAEPAFFYEPPERESDELVLVRRDGLLLFAVAFTSRPAASGQGTRIVYVTREGHRRSVALAELDLDATRDLNEARGSTVHLQ